MMTAGYQVHRTEFSKKFKSSFKYSVLK